MRHGFTLPELLAIMLIGVVLILLVIGLALTWLDGEVAHQLEAPGPDEPIAEPLNLERLGLAPEPPEGADQ